MKETAPTSSATLLPVYPRGMYDFASSINFRHYGLNLGGATKKKRIFLFKSKRVYVKRDETKMYHLSEYGEHREVSSPRFSPPSPPPAPCDYYHSLLYQKAK